MNNPLAPFITRRHDMPDSAQRTGTVHWVGAGLSNGSGLRRVAERADRMMLWNRNLARVEELADRLKLPAAVEMRPFKLAEFGRALSAGDIVVSMLPATQHAALLEMCIERRAHFACSSYVSDAISELVPVAERAGLVVLTESGLDPGLDHLLAQELVARARAATNGCRACISFVSYCGGIPATPNEFRYRFSWAPLGVLLALRSPARFVEGFEQRVVARPCEETRSYALDGEVFEVYPNRDSVPFIQQYDISEKWRVRDFVRGTLRHSGWRNAWRDIFATLETCDDAQLAALARDLAARYPTTDEDRDRVVLAIELRLMDGDRVVWAATAKVDAVGDHHESAMARYVSLPLACGVIDMLDGRMTCGLHRAAEEREALRRWLERLDSWGLRFAIDEDSQVGMEE
jgi:hypothetical protein